jgi:hypothetical protein
VGGICWLNAAHRYPGATSERCARTLRRKVEYGGGPDKTRRKRPVAPKVEALSGSISRSDCSPVSLVPARSKCLESVSRILICFFSSMPDAHWICDATMDRPRSTAVELRRLRYHGLTRCFPESILRMPTLPNSHDGPSELTTPSRLTNTARLFPKGQQRCHDKRRLAPRRNGTFQVLTHRGDLAEPHTLYSSRLRPPDLSSTRPVLSFDWSTTSSCVSRIHW